MSATKIVSLLVAGVLMLGACGGDSGDDPSGDAASTTTSAAPAAEEIAVEDLERAQSALLRLDDMPAGWSETAGEDDDPGSVTADEDFADCLGIDVDDLEPPDDLSFDSTFTDGDSMEVSSSASVWATAEDAETRLEHRTGDEALACIPDALEGMLEDLAEAEDDVTVEGVDVGRINLDLPGNAIALRITASMSAQGFDVDVFLDTVLGTVDNIGWSVTVQDVFSPPDPDTTAEYAVLVHGRLTGDSADSDSADSSEDEPAAPVGTRRNPVPLGEPAELDSWEVTLLSFELDATESLLAAEEFNDPPPEGMQYSLLRVRATFVGDGEGSPAMDLGFEVVGDDQRRYDESDCAVELSMLPEALYSEPDVFTGGVVEGHVCVLTPAGLGNPLVNVSATMSFESEPVWFAVT